MPTPIAMQSPRLRALSDQIRRGDRDAVDDFWRQMATETTPLVEADHAAPGVCLVTFLWRAVAPVANVVLLAELIPGDFPDMQMTRLGDTDVWYRTERFQSDVRGEYGFAPNDSLVPWRQETDWDRRTSTWRPDPLNPTRFPDPSDSADVKPHDSLGSIFALPDAAPLPWVGKRSGAAVGTVAHHRVASSELGNERDVWVYAPPGRSPAGLLILMDGEQCLSALAVPTVLDNLVDAGAIPPLLAVMVGNVDRGTELPCYRPFAQFLADELVPWVRDRADIPTDPARVIVAGQSYGGLAAVFAALERPDVFGNALSQSGSFWWKPDLPDRAVAPVLGAAPEYAWLSLRIAERPRAPVRLYLEAGRLEISVNNPTGPTLLQSNRHLRDVLVAKGYHVTYREFAGGHDYVWWRGTLADGLIALLDKPGDNQTV